MYIVQYICVLVFTALSKRHISFLFYIGVSVTIYIRVTQKYDQVLSWLAL